MQGPATVNDDVHVTTHRKIKELLREPREPKGHLAPSPTNRAIINNMNV